VARNYSNCANYKLISGNDDAGSKLTQDKTSISDRGSIKFLLNSGTASFIECFRFPALNERRESHNLHNSNLSNCTAISDLFTSSPERIRLSSDPFSNEQVDWSVLEDENLLRFLNTPFSDVQMQSDDLFTPFFMDPNFVSPPLNSDMPLPEECWEPASVRSAAIVQAILERAILLHLTAQEQADILQHLNYLFTPSRITKLVSLYFEFWHRNCPILHQLTFDIETASLPVLVSVVVMGAMYSQVDREISTAKSLHDLVELYIFSMEDLTDDSEIRQMLRATLSTSPDQVVLSSLAFEQVFAAYLMVCVQFWAGTIVSRKRAIETRFGIVVKVGWNASNKRLRCAERSSRQPGDWASQKLGMT
jgi:hypothetical protein